MDWMFSLVKGLDCYQVSSAPRHICSLTSWNTHALPWKIHSLDGSIRCSKPLSVDGAFLNVSSSTGTNAPSYHKWSSRLCSPKAPFLHDRVSTGICGCTMNCVYRQWFVEVILNPWRDDQSSQTTSIDILSCLLRTGISPDFQNPLMIMFCRWWDKFFKFYIEEHYSKIIPQFVDSFFL